MKLKSIIYLLSILIVPFSFMGCASSQPDDQADASTKDEKQQQELDDIEALLGISGNDEQAADNTATQSTKKETDKSKSADSKEKVSGDEKLNLLSTSDRVNISQDAGTEISSAEKKKLNNKIKTLQKKLNAKDRTIADLRAQVTMQEDELNKRPGGTTVISDISMDEYQSRYDEARSEFENHNYRAAIQLFESMLAASSTHPLAENAQYWIGECQYALRSYDAAIISFEKVFTFASPNKKDDAQFKLGLCYIRKKEFNKATEELNRLIEEYPKSEFLAKANRLLEKM